jgi:dTDP-4-dehydrorhamnose reductase
VSPTYVPDLVDASLDLLIDGECGVWHLANRGAATWAELAACAVAAAGLDRGLVVPVPGASLGYTAPRPRNVPLASERGALMPTLEQAIDRYLAELAPLAPADAIDRGLPLNDSHAVPSLAA